MKGILEIIWKFINSRLFGYISIILLIFILANQCKKNRDLKRENIIKDQNISAANDSIKSYRDKNGKLTSEKSIWILTEKNLKNENRKLYNEIKAQRGKIISLNNIIFGLKQDSIILHDTIKYLKRIIGNSIQLDKTTWSLPWELHYKWDEKNYDDFYGHTIVQLDTINLKIIHKNTLLDKRTGNIELTFGEKIVDNKFNVYVTTSYPGLSTKSLEGVFIDPNSNNNIKKLIKKDHLFTGFSFSVGITPGWDFINKKPSIIIGPTIGYSIFSW